MVLAQKVSLPNVTYFVRKKVTAAGRSPEVSDYQTPFTSSVNNERDHLRFSFLVLGGSHRPDYFTLQHPFLQILIYHLQCQIVIATNADFSVPLCGKNLQHLQACRRSRD